MPLEAWVASEWNGLCLHTPQTLTPCLLLPSPSCKALVLAVVLGCLWLRSSWATRLVALLVSTVGDE